jgi:2-iminobutanoate/2-iminopropanoate deaminase
MRMKKEIFNSNRLATTHAPYSQAVISENLVFISGQVALDPDTGVMVSGKIEDEVNQVLTNLKIILEELGTSMDNVLKVTVFLRDISMFGRFNDTYKRHFPHEPPARSAVEVSDLPLGANVEIEAIAHL